MGGAVAFLLARTFERHCSAAHAQHVGEEDGLDGLVWHRAGERQALAALDAEGKNNRIVGRLERLGLFTSLNDPGVWRTRQGADDGEHFLAKQPRAVGEVAECGQRICDAFDGIRRRRGGLNGFGRRFTFVVHFQRARND